MTREQTQELAQVFSLSAPVATALTLAQGFVKMLREKQVEALPAWLESAQASSRKASSGAVRQWRRLSADLKAMGKWKGT